MEWPDGKRSPYCRSVTRSVHLSTNQTPARSTKKVDMKIHYTYFTGVDLRAVQDIPLYGCDSSLRVLHTAETGTIFYAL